MTSKIRPTTVRNRIMYVLAIHGVQPDTAQSIYDTLTSGNDPRPSNLPPSFTFQGVTLHYPSGVGRRIITPLERKVFNQALRRNGNDLLDSEDTAHDARKAYTALWNKQQRLMYELVDTATTTNLRVPDPCVRCGHVWQEAYSEECPTHFCMPELSGQPRLEDGRADEAATRLLNAIFGNAHEQLDNVLCGHKKPGGRLLCLEDNHHAGLHRNGKHAWTEDAAVIEHHAPKRMSVKAKVAKPKKDDLDDLMAQLNELSNRNAQTLAHL